MAEHDVLPCRQVVEVDHTVAQPLAVWLLGSKRVLDLLVVDDPALTGVDQKHLAWLQSALGDHLGWVDLQHANFGCHDHKVVIGHPIPARAQAVAVEHGTDHGAIGEGHACRSVPGLHHARMEAVEGAPIGVHLGVVFPGLGNHHQHGVMQRAPGKVKQFQHLVEAGRVRRASCTDRERLVEVRKQGAGGHRLTRPHPVLVALDRVDLAVVGDVTVRVRQRPRRERVGREPRVHKQQCAFDARISQVTEELTELRGGEHPLVDDRARRQR